MKLSAIGLTCVKSFVSTFSTFFISFCFDIIELFEFEIVILSFLLQLQLQLFFYFCLFFTG